MRNLTNPISDRGNWVHQRTSADKTTWRQRMVTRAVLNSVAILLGGWLLVSCGDGAVAAENANPEVVFDGTSCIYNGPAKIQRGGTEFTLINESDTAIDLFALLYDDPTDFRADLDSLPVGTDAAAAITEVPPDLHFALALNAQPGEQATTLTLLDIGEFILQCGHTQPDERFPDYIWRAATIEIVP